MATPLDSMNVRQAPVRHAGWLALALVSALVVFGAGSVRAEGGESDPGSASGSASAAAPPLRLAPAPAFHARHVMVVDDASGEVLLSKGAQESVPMASLTKLMTAMVVLDAELDPQEPLTIEVADLDTLKHTRSGLPVGATLPREKMLELALMASDNHAAFCLARHYPGGLPAFLDAARAKAAALGLASTYMLEPTGLSPDNRSSASDLAVVAHAAAGYPAIAAATTQSRGQALVNGRAYTAHNTNGLVGKPGWDILLSKTGFTNEAGRCLVMRLRSAGKTVLVVLLNARAGAARTLDAVNITRWLSGLAVTGPVATAAVAPSAAIAKPGRRAARGRRHSIGLI